MIFNKVIWMNVVSLLFLGCYQVVIKILNTLKFFYIFCLFKNYISTIEFIHIGYCL